MPAYAPQLTFPEIEARVIKEAYQNARVILEYGSGGSTALAASLEEKFIMSVESDLHWARGLQNYIDNSCFKSSVIIHHSDIGPTGEWGRPLDEKEWRKFYTYPTEIWAQKFFRQPDIVLIDGRLRPACFVATCLRIKKPTTVLFDDYVNRLSYHVVEKLASPFEIHGRMAEFKLIPKKYPIWANDLFNAVLGDVSFASEDGYPSYAVKSDTGYPFNRNL